MSHKIRSHRLRKGRFILDKPEYRFLKSYELHEQIGAGGFGVVYRAFQPLLKRPVAIKAILPEYANQPDFIRRFEVEAELVARLEHPHIIPLYDYWREPDGAYLVMRWLAGGSLRHALEQEQWDMARITRLVDEITAALMVAHRHGVVHRDIKPDNILLDEDENAYLADFGIAKDLGGVEVTQGEVIGSPAYFAPEQIRSEIITAKTDQYSLGVMLFEIVTGTRPYPNATLSDILFKHLNEPLPLLQERRPDLPTALNDVLQQATAKDPANRYADVLEFAAAFHAALARFPAQSDSRHHRFDGHPAHRSDRRLADNGRRGTRRSRTRTKDCVPLAKLMLPISSDVRRSWISCSSVCVKLMKMRAS